MKDRIATYVKPGKPDMPPKHPLVLHEPTCPVLHATPARPYMGSRTATPAEKASHAPCKRC